MKKILLFFVLAGLLLGLFLGIRSTMLNKEEKSIKIDATEATYKDELILPLVEIDTLNPILTNNKQVLDVLKLIYEPLFEFDIKNKLSPILGVEYMEKDNLTWIISLRKDVMWHSNKNFTAIDVLFTIDSIKSNPQSPYYNSLKNVYYCEELDNYTIAIYLYERDVNLPYKLTFPIMPQYYFKDSLAHVEKTNRPIGTGPYKYVSSDDEKFVLSFNSNWWKEVKAKLNTIYLVKYQSYGEAIKAFKSSEIDVITTSMDSWRKKFGVIGINSYSYESDKYEMIIPNCNKIVLRDSAVRRAILYAINRENIIDDVYENNAIKQDLMIHSYSWLNDKSQEVEYSIDKSKQLLTNSKWYLSNNVWNKTIDGKIYSLKLNLMVLKDNDTKKNACKIIKENLDSIGIKISIVEVDEATYIKNIENGNFDLAYGTLETINDFDVIDLLKTKNYSNYNSAELDDDLNQLFISNVYLENSFKSFKLEYRNELPYIGLYYKTNTLLTNKAVKGSITPTIHNPYNNIWTWSK